MSAVPKYLYHGARVADRSAIHEVNLMPRRDTGVSQWEHTVASREDAVYLSTPYPLHFAINAQGDGDLVVFEVDTAHLDHSRLVADEDALAHCLKEPSTEGMPLLERTLYYRDRSSGYSAEFSLTRLGTCAHLGPIPRRAVRRAVLIEAKHAGTLILGGFDPVIHPINYQIHGTEYTDSVRWLFRDTEECAVNPRMPDIPREVFCVNADE